MVQTDTVWRNEEHNNAGTCSSWSGTRCARANCWIFWKPENKYRNAQVSLCFRQSVSTCLWVCVEYWNSAVYLQYKNMWAVLITINNTGAKQHNNSITQIFLEKLTVSQPLKKFYTFYGTQIFFTLYPEARHFYLFWTKSIHSTTLYIIFVDPF